MKDLTNTILIVTCAIVGLSTTSHGQDDLLESAMEMNDKRKAGLEGLQDMIFKMGWLEEAKKRLSTIEERNEKREVDPFGVSMDPTKTVVAPVVEPEAVEDTVEDVPKGPTAAEALAAALQKINVTGVFPGHGEIMVGARSLRVGSVLVVSQGQTQYKVQITKVASDAVYFRDMATGVEAKSPLSVMPTGVFEGISRRAPNEGLANTIVPMNREVYQVNPEENQGANGDQGVVTNSTER